MKKFSLFIVTLALVVLFAGADYLVNTPRSIDKGVLAQISAQGALNQIKLDHGSASETDPNMVQTMLGDRTQNYSYTLQSRARTYQIFETFDLRLISNIRLYKNELAGEEPLVIYEIHGPKNQGKLTYLNVKLKMLDQVDLRGNINETNEFGESSLFYNDDNTKNTAFLLVQTGDTLFGFQYKKESKETFDTVVRMINTLLSLTITS